MSGSSAKMTQPWDYLILTAANARQAAAYEDQIRLRHEAGELSQVRHFLVVADIDDKRIGSAGSTLHCLAEVLQREAPQGGIGDFEEAISVLRRLRILMVHAGGDSRRLPVYSHGGKIFVPVPASSTSPIPVTLFDLLIPALLALPKGPQGGGQIVVASGDALLQFEVSDLDLAAPGMTLLGSFTSPEEAARHGVFCAGSGGLLRLYLQKPSVDAQINSGAVNQAGQSILDLGVMSMDASTAIRLMRAFFELTPAAGGPTLRWRAGMQDVLMTQGIDLYREICCALGAEATFNSYSEGVRASGSKLDAAILKELFEALSGVHVHLQVLSDCDFLHFGTTRQLITSGIALRAGHQSAPPDTSVLVLSSQVIGQGSVSGDHAWVEGCCISAPLVLPGGNVAVGLDVLEPLTLPPGACLDVSAGSDRKGKSIWLVRCCGVDDNYKQTAAAGGTFCGKPLLEWMRVVGVSASDLWTPELPERDHTLWNARVCPAEAEHLAYRRWLWMFDVERATPEQKRSFLAADRYSSSQIALLLSQSAFHKRRSMLWSTASSTVQAETRQRQECGTI
ncbi:MAG: L-fucokinase [Candidatus Sulfotelmatobacter sp.]|jgi:fucokinase